MTKNKPASDSNNYLQTSIRAMFIQLVSDLNNFKESESFLTDFFTPGELEKFTKRLAVFYWKSKDRNNSNIVKNVRIPGTELKKVLKIKDRAGIKLALKKIEAEEWASKWSSKLEKITKLMS